MADGEQPDSKQARAEMGYTGHVLTTTNPVLVELQASQRSTASLNEVSQEERHCWEMDIMQQKLKLMEQHYENQQDLH